MFHWRKLSTPLRTHFRTIVVALLLLGGNSAFAHDPLQGWTTARLFPDRIELDVSMSQFASVALLEKRDSVSAEDFEVETFEKIHGLFKACAPALYEVSAAGELLKPIKYDAEVNGEADMRFLITYPRPANGPLHFNTLYLKRMPEGFIATLEVMDNKNNNLAWEELNADTPALELTLINTTPTSAPSPAVPQDSLTPPRESATAQAYRSNVIYSVVGLAAVVVVVIYLRRMSHPRS